MDMQGFAIQKFSLAPMGALATWSAQASPSASPPSTPAVIFQCMFLWGETISYRNSRHFMQL
jgi:hypothetical protein